MCVSSLPSRLSQFRIVLEIYSIEFNLFWEFHDIVRPLATPRETCFYVCKYLHWISVGTKIGTSIVFELENQKWRLNTRKDQVFTQMWVISEQKITKKFTDLWLSSYYRKGPNATLTNLCSNKIYFITNISGKFHSGLQCSSYFMINLLNISRFRFLERFTV